MRALPWLVLAAAAVFLAGESTARGQSFRRGGSEFNALRSVSLPAGAAPTIVVTEFLHHGEIASDGRNVVVSGRNQELVPCRILQLGPGDFCRLAIQTVGNQTEYDIFYGGEPPTTPPPKWTASAGLLLETREYKTCNLKSFESVRDAFRAAKPIGADYVENVQHADNPFSLKVGPFLSKYTGVLHLCNAGKYGFLTSSQDASFLVIDDKVVIDAPGHHGPAHVARPGSRTDVRLAAGEHKFEYFHAAAGNAAMMVAAWEINAQEDKPKPVLIPSELFYVKAVAHLPAGFVAMRTTKLVPDFQVKIEGDVPLADNDLPLVGVAFRDASPKAVSMGAKAQWDFGDGQVSDKLNVDHVYLRPGLYTVKLSFRRAGKTVEMANRIYIDRPKLTHKDKLHALDSYLAILDDYDITKLDAAAVRQLVLAYVAKADEMLARHEDQRVAETAKAGDSDRKAEDAKRGAKPKRPVVSAGDSLEADSARFLVKAVAVGKVPFVAGSAAKGDEDLYRLAQLVGPMARDMLGNSGAALDIWKGAAVKLNIADLKADCEIEAADITVNDLVDTKTAKRFLDAAAQRMGNRRAGATAAKLYRVWGDYHALTGDGKAARKAYAESEQVLGAGKRYIEQTAWRGARSRSTEEFIKSGRFDRAATELREWQREFPAEKIEGYLTLLWAQYWAAREKYAPAIAQAEQLQSLNRDSAYADRILWLAADCALKLGQKDRALATLHALVKDYPGSPLQADAKELIGRIDSAATDEPKKRPRTKPVEY